MGIRYEDLEHRFARKSINLAKLFAGELAETEIEIETDYDNFSSYHPAGRVKGLPRLLKEGERYLQAIDKKVIFHELDIDSYETRRILQKLPEHKIKEYYKLFNLFWGIYVPECMSWGEARIFGRTCKCNVAPERPKRNILLLADYPMRWQPTDKEPKPNIIMLALVSRNGEGPGKYYHIGDTTVDIVYFDPKYLSEEKIIMPLDPDLDQYRKLPEEAQEVRTDCAAEMLKLIAADAMLAILAGRSVKVITHDVHTYVAFRDVKGKFKQGWSSKIELKLIKHDTEN